MEKSVGKATFGLALIRQNAIPARPEERDEPSVSDKKKAAGRESGG